VLDSAASLFEGLLGGGPSPEQVQQAKDTAQAPPPAPEPSPPYAALSRRQTHGNRLKNFSRKSRSSGSRMCLRRGR